MLNEFDGTQIAVCRLCGMDMQIKDHVLNLPTYVCSLDHRWQGIRMRTRRRLGPKLPVKNESELTTVDAALFT